MIIHILKTKDQINSPSFTLNPNQCFDVPLGFWFHQSHVVLVQSSGHILSWNFHCQLHRGKDYPLDHLIKERCHGLRA